MIKFVKNSYLWVLFKGGCYWRFYGMSIATDWHAYCLDFMDFMWAIINKLSSLLSNYIVPYNSHSQSLISIQVWVFQLINQNTGFYFLTHREMNFSEERIYLQEIFFYNLMYFFLKFSCTHIELIHFHILNAHISLDNAVKSNSETM